MEEDQNGLETEIQADEELDEANSEDENDAILNEKKENSLPRDNI